MIYLANRFFYRLGDFFHHWYADGSKIFFNYFLNFLERLDRKFAIRITLRYFFQPLYRDYTVVGRILGVIFRSGRILIGGAVYVSASVVFLLVYFLWLAIPPLIFLYVIGAK